MTAAHLMTVRPVTIRPEATLDEAARKLSQNNIKEIPVADNLGRVLGLLTIDDVIGVPLENAAKGASDFDNSLGALGRITASGLTAKQHKDAPHAFSCIGPEASLSEVATLLTDGKRRILLVTDNAERLLGVISATDVVRHLSTGK